MAGSLNRVILVGNVGRDPEVRTMQDGNKVVNVSLATSETWRDKQSGERKEKSEWHRIVSFNEQANKALEAYVKKGSKILIEGSLQTRKWTDQSGTEKYSTEVVLQRFGSTLQLLDKRDDSGGGSGGGAGGGYGGDASDPNSEILF